MRLTLKLTIGIVLAILPVIAVNSGVRVAREIAASEASLHADDAVLGRTIADATIAVWRSSGEAEARLVVDGANRHQREVGIRWVWLGAVSSDRDAPQVDLRARGGLGDQPLVLRAPRSSDTSTAAFTYIPATTPDGRRGAIEIQRSLAAEQSFIHDTTRHAAIATGAVIGLCGFLALGLGALLVGRPVSRLVVQTRRIGTGDLSTRLHPTQRDELGQLGTEIDLMCDRLEEARDRVAAATSARLSALEQLRHADRLSTVGKLAAGVAHELGTPLNVISGHAQLITSDHEPGTAAYENAAIVIEQTQRVAGIIRQLLDFARRRAPARTPLELEPLVRETLALLAPLAAERHVAVDVEVTGGALVCNVDHGQIQQAITNLVVNGLQAIGRNGRIGITMSRQQLVAPADHGGRKRDCAVIEVADNGTGIGPDVLPHIFEPFFTSKDVGEGTGLGLSVTYGIVNEHDGWIDVVSKPGDGSRFAICLPLDHALSTNQRKGTS